MKRTVKIPDQPQFITPIEAAVAFNNGECVYWNNDKGEPRLFLSALYTKKTENDYEAEGPRYGFVRLRDSIVMYEADSPRECIEKIMAEGRTVHVAKNITEAVLPVGLSDISQS